MIYIINLHYKFYTDSVNTIILQVQRTPSRTVLVTSSVQVQVVLSTT